MDKPRLRINEVRSCLIALHKQVSDVSEQIHQEAASLMIVGEHKTGVTLMDLGSSISNFARHIDMCMNAWDNFAEEAQMKLGQLENKRTGPAAGEA
jgi:hypothetical protein